MTLLAALKTTGLPLYDGKLNSNNMWSCKTPAVDLGDVKTVAEGHLRLTEE